MNEEIEPTVLYRVEDGVAVVTLNRPDKMNAWTPAMGDLYMDLLQQAGRDPEVRVIVVTGAGRAFCAGADAGLLAEVSGEGTGAPKGRHQPVETLDIPKPVICAINGAAVGLGLAFALMCDIRFAGAGAKLGTGFTRLGLVAEHGVSWILPRLVGQPAAMELLLSGRIFVAEEAQSMGMIRKVFAREELMAETMAYAKDLAENCSPLSMALIKRQVYRHQDMEFYSALRESNALTDRSTAFADFKEGLAAYGEKRKPVFAGISSVKLNDPVDA